MERTFLVAGAALAFLGVALGAFAAHGLEGRVDEAALRAFETGVRYQMYHALALLWIGWALARWPTLAPGGWLLLGGTILFSGSLYVLSTTDLRWMGPVTPVGGLTLMAGWAVVLRAVWKV